MNQPLLTSQTTSKPSRKVVVGNASGASLTTLVTVFTTFFLGRYFSPEPMPEDVHEILPYLVIVIQGLITFICQYFIKNRVGEV